MSIKNEQTGEQDFQKMPYLMRLYDEICFDSLLFKSPKYDYCRVMKQPVYDCHGFSRFFALSLNRQNFRPFVLFVACLDTFFFLCFLQIWLYQTHLELKSSNFALRFVELHVITFIRCFASSPDSATEHHSSRFNMIHLALCLFLTEIFLAQTSQRLLVYLYAIGRQMTVLEVENPFLFAKSRHGSLFQVRAQKQVDDRTQKVHLTRKYEIKNDQASLGRLIANCFMFLVAGQPLKRSLVGKSKRGQEAEMRLWQLAEIEEKRGAAGQEVEM